MSPDTWLTGRTQQVSAFVTVVNIATSEAEASLPSPRTGGPFQQPAQLCRGRAVSRAAQVSSRKGLCFLLRLSQGQGKAGRRRKKKQTKTQQTHV